MAFLIHGRESPMRYRQALEYVLSFADYERASSARVRYRDFNLERVRELLTRIGDPDRSFASGHVAGTKGKGSTSAMIASVLRRAGYRTGLYTSPHLHTMRERIAVDGEPVSEDAFAAGVLAMQPAVEAANASGELGRLTTFELLTALAFWYFREREARYAVLEVGMGGRLDATNVVTPVACAVTNISLDHTEVLGDTLAKIAAEKAAIIKPGVPVVSGPQQREALEVIERAAFEQAAPMTLVGRDVTWRACDATLDGQRLTVKTRRGQRDLWVPLAGAYQQENVATAVAVCDILAEGGAAIGEQALRDGLAETSWPGRFELLSRRPIVVADGAHNPYSMGRLRETVEALLPGRRLAIVFGANRTKNVGGMLDALAGLPAALIATHSRHPKAMPAREVVLEATRRGLRAEAATSPPAALERARELAGSDGAIVATGSLFIVAEVREAVLGIPPELYPSSAVTV